MVPRYGHVAVKFNDDQVLLLGGTLSLNHGQEEESSYTSELLDVQRVVELYGDEEKELKTTELEELKGVPDPFTKQGQEVNTGHFVRGL